MFIKTRTFISNPYMQLGGYSQTNRPTGRRSFVTFDYGDLNGFNGYWAMDEEGEEGFLEESNDSFWTYKEEDDTWTASAFAGGQTCSMGSSEGFRNLEVFKAKGLVRKG